MRKYFVEIGTCDFDTLVPLAENGWSGIFVEPICAYLDSLPRYANVIYENSVIGNIDSKIPFVYYDPSLADYIGDDWVKGVGTTSLDINHFFSNPQWKSYERRIVVNSLTLDSLFNKHNVCSVDFMKVDVEGSEFDIFKNYSWNLKPTMLKVETRHWEGKEQYHNISIEIPMLEMLKSNGYVVWKESSDLYAIR